MTACTLRREVAKLRQDVLPRVPPSECDRPCVGLIIDEGEPYDEADGVPCPRCGTTHLLILRVEIVEPPGDDAPTPEGVP
jgi:hypothetical protein